jgi:hypothetical protein
MGVLDNALKKKPSGPTNTEEPKITPFKPTVDLNLLSDTDINALRETKDINPISPVPTPNKWNYIPDRWIQDRIERFKNLDPTKNSYEQIYQSSVLKPTEPDENKIQKAKLAGSIGDALGLLSQMWTYGKGAHVEKRDYNNSAMAKADAKERELRNLYMQQQDKYNTGLYNARMGDLKRDIDDWNNERKGIQDILDAKQKQDWEKEQFNAKQQFGYDKLKQDQGNKDRDYELKKQNNENLDTYRKNNLAETVRTHKAHEGIAYGHLKNDNARTKLASENGKNGAQTIYVDANPNDPSGKKNRFGRNEVEINLNPSEFNNYVALGETLLKSDPEFAKKAGLILREPVYDMMGKESGTYQITKDKTLLAKAAAQYWYDKQFKQNPTNSASHPSYIPNIYAFDNDNRYALPQNVVDQYNYAGNAELEDDPDGGWSF